MISHLGQSISPVDHLDQEMLVLGEYLRVKGEEALPVGTFATYYRTSLGLLQSAVN